MELEALASRKFSRYYNYVELHAKLRDCTSLQECAETSRELIDSYIENRMIWEELAYYKDNKIMLGKHPAFAEFQRRSELLRLPIKELVHRQRQVENNIWRVKSEIEKNDKPHLNAVRNERLFGYEKELADINRLLK